ncbi:MAG: DUF983 domain-containing protein [Alphaproteobacteria bacterium]|nr:DUF983 domain-containing protein [Alphaproteobacteria bacterium]
MRTLVQQLLAPRCPACGKGRLFKDMLGVVDTCATCHLALGHHDAADGPTFFALVIVGFLVTGLAAWVEITYEPALWVHALLWVPFTFVASILCLRSFKTLLVTIQYRLKQMEGPPHA